jgi:hypothetical protein
VQNEPTTKTSIMKGGVSLGQATNRWQSTGAPMDGSRFQDFWGIHLFTCVSMSHIILIVQGWFSIINQF